MLPINCVSLSGTRDIRYFETKLFLTFICALLITFAKNCICPANRTCHTNFMQGQCRGSPTLGPFQNAYRGPLMVTYKKCF